MPPSHLHPPPDCAQESNEPATPVTLEQPLSRDELEVLIEFFKLLNTWDNNKKIA